MAFHQATRQAMQRVARPTTEDREVHAPTQNHQGQALEQSQTWVLFEPASETTASDLSEIVPSLQTAGRSQLSDIGSLHTAPRSDHLLGTPSVGDEEAFAEDDAELDSLDSHLPSFRSIPGFHAPSHAEDHQAAPVFPGHDGLGSFHVNNPISGPEAQDQIYQFERFNPRRVRRRRESLEHAQVEFETEHTRDSEKRQRIEEWRLEHSRILLQEVEKETKRRRRSQASLRHVQSMTANTTGSRPVPDAESDNMTWHDEDAVVSEEEPQSLLASITQRVIKDLLGIDDRLLSILIGETMPEEDDLSSTPRASQMNLDMLPDSDESSWQLQLLERVSKELGLLVSRLSHHPGAFSTYSKIQQMPLPYAGLPAIPEAPARPLPEPNTTAPEFKPTVRQASQPISIPGKQEDVTMDNAFTKDEWEQDLDMNLVFRYIRSRFSSRASNTPISSSAHLATSSTQDTAAKAARVRQHHPLIARSRPIERRAFRITTPSSPVATRHHGSCASQSSRRSARRSSVSSRHYWDIGGSLGTGSVIASNGPMGSWGEV